MIPPKFVPPGILQLYEVNGNEKILVEELPTTPQNRDRINKMRNDLLMVNPSKDLRLSENNAWR